MIFPRMTLLDRFLLLLTPMRISVDERDWYRTELHWKLRKGITYIFKEERTYIGP